MTSPVQPTTRWRLAIVPLASLLLVACTSLPSGEQRRQHAAERASAHDWQALTLNTEPFALRAFVPRQLGQQQRLTLYLEGDGLAWVNRSQPSGDPTPVDPVALRLALAQPTGAAAYLARPCQYLDSTQAPCQQRYWTDARFSQAVVSSLDQAIEQLKNRVGARQLVLVGYSGGGALALLLAARRNDVEGVITVAGNLDPDAWTRYHRVQPLQASLNPASVRPRLATLPQIHLVGGQDRIVPLELAQAFVAGYAAGHRARVQVLADYDHHCCWAENWAQLWAQLHLP